MAWLPELLGFRLDCRGRRIPESFGVSYPRETLAESLWEYGEDELATAAMQLTDAELHQIQRLDVWHHENDPEPEAGPRLLHARISARAAIEYFERRRRDTVRQRRRTRPEAEQYTAGAPLLGPDYPGRDRFVVLEARRPRRAIRP